MGTVSTTPRVKKATSSPRRTITVHPLSKEGFHQIWETQTGVDYGPGYEGFDSHEGTYGYFYPLDDGHVVFCNQFGRPKTVFNTHEEASVWLQGLAAEVEWI